jgi:hypothetical protein
MAVMSQYGGSEDGELKMKPILSGLLLSAVAVFAVVPTAGWAKTVKECEAEWQANKAAIQASGQTKKDFVAACRAEAATGHPVLTDTHSRLPSFVVRAQT